MSVVIDDEDRARMAIAVRRERELVIAALRKVTMPVGSPDKWRRRRVVEADLDRFSDELARLLDTLAWKYRRQMPKHLAPKINPDDPLVRELAQKEQAHG